MLRNGVFGSSQSGEKEHGMCVCDVDGEDDDPAAYKQRGVCHEMCAFASKYVISPRGDEMNGYNFYLFFRNHNFMIGRFLFLI